LPGGGIARVQKKPLDDESSGSFILLENRA
jgi:hypothetical protein